MIRWGILGAGNIARRFAASLRSLPDCSLYAISGRSAEKLAAFAREFPCQQSYTDYQALLEDPKVDAVYLSLPHGLHFTWATAALRAHKPVLCEKPAMLCAAQMRQIRQTAEQERVLFMEGMKTRFTPLYRTLRHLILEEGVIGELVRLETSYCNVLPVDWVGKTYHTEPGQGGALLDGGIYCASWLEDYLGSEGKLSHVRVNLSEVDLYVNAEMELGGVQAVLETGFDRAKEKNAILVGATGRIVVPNLHRPTQAVLYREGEAPLTLSRSYEIDDFYGEIRHFCDCLERGLTVSPRMPLSASVRCAELLDQIRTGFSVYDEKDLSILEAQEQALTLPSFSAETALQLGNLIVQIDQEYDRTVAIQIFNEQTGDVVFQYLMDGKSSRNLQFTEMKRQAVLKTGHSSAWACIQNRIEAARNNIAPDRSLSGGAFPIYVDGQHIATVAVSGLHEGHDHDLLIQAMSTQSGKVVPVFSKALF